MRQEKKMAEVSISNVRKIYGSTQVIHDLSIKVNDGEFVVLVGKQSTPF